MGIGSLGYWEAIKNFFKWLLGTYLEYTRKKKARRKQKEEARKQYEKAQKQGDAANMLNSFEKMKRNRDD